MLAKFYLFDFHGSYLGYLENEALYEPGGQQWGWLRDQRVVDVEGRNRGRLDAQGAYFDDRGSCRGYVRGWPASQGFKRA